MYDNLKPICDAITGTAPETVNDQAAALLKAVTGEEAEFNIGGTLPSFVATLVHGQSTGPEIDKLSAKSVQTTPFTISAIDAPIVGKLLHGLEYFDWDASIPSSSRGEQDPTSIYSGQAFACLCNICDADEIDLTSTEDQYPTKWLGMVYDLDDLCCKLYWFKIDLREIPNFTTTHDMIAYLMQQKGDQYTLGEQLRIIGTSVYCQGIAYVCGSSSDSINLAGAYKSTKILTLTHSDMTSSNTTLGGQAFYPMVREYRGTSGNYAYTYWPVEAGTTSTLAADALYISKYGTTSNARLNTWVQSYA